MSKRGGFALGIAAGVVAMGTMFLLRYAVGVPTFPELAQDSIVQLFPGEAASAIIDKLQKAAKLLLFGTLIPVQLGVLGLLGLWFSTRPRSRSAAGSPAAAGLNWLRGLWGYPLVWALAWWLLVVVVLLPNSGLGFFGSATSNGALVTALATLGPPLTFALGLMLGGELARSRQDRQQPQTVPSPVLDRRRFLGLSLATVIGAILGGSAFRAFISGQDSAPPLLIAVPEEARLQAQPSATPTVVGHPGTPGVPASEVPRTSATPSATPLPDGAFNPDNVPGMPSQITSNADFYVVSKNVIDPTVRVSRWHLSVEGLVENAFQLTYDELRALPAVSQYTTLICISNPVGGPLISNARWTGVRLRDLLERARLKPGVKDIALFAADGYSDSIPLEKAMEPTTLVAYGMNGEVLPTGHGAPARLVVPGIYGMKNVKWLTGIEATDEDFKGFWERQGWSDRAVIKTMSRIDVPEPRIVKPGRNALGGIAFAGVRGIAKVEWSADGGSTWQEALVEPALSPFAWVRWVDEWSVQEAGRFRLLVRATDATGEVQTSGVIVPYPDGASGHHEISVTVRS